MNMLSELSLFEVMPKESRTGTAIFKLFLAGMLCWFGWILCNQYWLVVKLHEAHEQCK